MNILVTDGENRSALAVVRSLGRTGCKVFVAGRSSGTISACSKYCSGAFTTPDPLVDIKNYSKSISEIVIGKSIDVIFPTTEQSIYCLNKVRDQLGQNVILACAPSDKMEAVSNKYRLFQLAEKLGVAIPETIYVTDTEDFQKKREGIVKFPVVVKPSFSKIEHDGKIISAGVIYASNSRELSHHYETNIILQYPSLIQELIVGEGTGLFTLFDQDRHLALFSHRRILEKPPSGGVSVISESVPLDDEMVQAAKELLAGVEWPGIAMVEFKRDIKDGRAKLMEINGRFWGSLQLAVSSGVDFPVLCLDYHLGRKPPKLLSEFTEGQRLKWFLGILDHLIIRLCHNESLLNLPMGSPSLWQVARELVKAREVNTSYDVYDSLDLKPFFAEIKAYVRNIF